MAYGGMMGQTPLGGAPFNGLPTNDVRELTVRSGYDISAGDVVDVEGGEVFKSVVKKPNENFEVYLYDKATTRGEMITKLKKISDKYSIIVYGFADNTSRSSYAGPRAMLLDNITKKPIKNSEIRIGVTSDLYDYYITAIDVTPISESLVFTVVENPNDDTIAVNLIKITEQSLSIVDSTSFQTESSYGVGCVKLNNENKVLLVYSDGNRPYYKVYQLTDSSITVLKDQTMITAFGQNYIKFVNTLHIDENIICVLASSYAHTDACYGSIAYFNNDTNTMSFARAITDIFANNCTQIRAVNNGHTIYAMCYLNDEHKYVGKVLTVSGYSIIVASKEVEVDSNPDTGLIEDSPYRDWIYRDDIFLFNDKIVMATINNTVMFQKDIFAPSELKLVTNNAGFPQIITGSSWRSLSIIPIDNKNIWYGYGAQQNSANKPQAVVTPLTVYNNQFGNWLSTSKTAIALQSASSNQPISVGFGGYCECPNITQGQMITSSGVMGYGVQDGWLDIRPEYWSRGGSNVVTGTFTTASSTSTTLEVNIGFEPSVVMIYNGSGNNNIVVPNAKNDGNALDMAVIRIITKQWNAENGKITNTGFTFRSNSTNAKFQYIAWR